jgi:hypothetical protein
MATFLEVRRASARLSLPAAVAIALTGATVQRAAGQSAAASIAATAPAAPGTVTISLAEYNRLNERAAAPATPPAAVPVGAFVAQADLALRADGDLLRGTITLQGDVLREGPTGVPLLSGGTLIAARLNGQAVPILQDRGAFHAVLPGAGPFALQLEWVAPVVTEPGRAASQLPALTAGSIRATIDAPGERSDVVVDRAVVTRRTPGRGRLVVEAALAPGGGARVIRSSREAVTAAPARALRLLDDVKTLVTVGESDLRVTAIFDVTVLQGLTSSLTLRLPQGFTVSSFTGAPSEVASEADGRLVLTVPAGMPRLQFLVALERALPDAAARRAIALPSLEGSQRETGDAAIEGVGALELAVEEARPLQRIDVAELAAALTTLARDPILSAYRYQRRGSDPVTLAFGVTRFPDAAVLAAGADRATATTLVTAEGRSLTEVTLTVRNQAQPFLKVGLPSGATLLSAEVAGVAVKPAQGADGLRIPLLRPGFRPAGPYAVSFVYLHSGAPFAARGEASLALAALDLPVAWLEWELFLPDRLQASRFAGDAIPRELVPLGSPGEPKPADLAEPVTTASGATVRQKAIVTRGINEQSMNVQNLQKRAAGVLPVRLDVPRAGQSHTFVRPLVLDEPTTVAFHYKLRK